MRKLGACLIDPLDENRKPAREISQKGTSAHIAAYFSGTGIFSPSLLQHPKKGGRQVLNASFKGRLQTVCSPALVDFEMG
jgi:hypothetical protein